MLGRYLADDYAPDRVAPTVGIAAYTIRRIARELAETAFEKEIALPIAWTDWAGRRHERIVGRPVSFHAMRGIAAHSNGFQTCRALHLLQLLLGSVDVPGGYLAKPSCPRPSPPGRRPGGQTVRPGEPLREMPLGWPLEPDHLLVDDAGRPTRIDRAYSWEHPFAAHGAMHLVLRDAWAGDPYPIDVLFLYMANMGWNSAMALGDTHRYLTDKNEDGTYRIPRIIYSDAYHSEMVAYADLVLPDTTYLERWDCISLLDRPISTGHGPADAVRRPVVPCDRDVRPFQDVLLDLGARLGLPGMVDDKGLPLYAGGYVDYMVRHERSPGVGLLAGWRGATGDEHGRGAPNPRQLERYVENGCFWHHELAPEQRYLKHANKAYLEYAAKMGWIAAAEPIVFQLYLEPLQRFRLAARGHGSRLPPEHLRPRIERYFDPLPVWHPPLAEAHQDGARFPLHAVTQRPMHMYHAWGSQNAWLRQITTRNWLYVHPDIAAALGLKDDDWAWITSSCGRVKAQIRTMRAMNRDTVWTWNAIGKRAGAWGLDPASPEAREGFLLNHLIPDVFGEDERGAREANADPITGQAAWYDLRVALEKCVPEECGESAPHQERVAPMPHPPVPVAVQRYGRKFNRTSMPRKGPLRHHEWVGNRDDASD
jgi:anaerobic selenocysteine-containing dehydrogenase